MALTVHIITPERSLPACPADHITFTAEDGELGVRPGHAPLAAVLKTGYAMIRHQGVETLYALRSGFAQVLDDKISLYVDQVEDVGHIDVDKVQAALDKLGQTKTTDPLQAKRNELEAKWYLMQIVLAQRKALGSTGLTSVDRRSVH